MRGIMLPTRVVPGPRGIVIPKNTGSSFFSLHSHSVFSANDALPQVKDMVEVVKGYNQPALALTDHGNMAGAIQLYTNCKKAGILPFPGLEAYIKPDAEDKKAPRFHMGLVAFTTEGYEALVKLSSRSHTRDRFYHKPHIDFRDMAEWKERGWTNGIIATTGCFFGLVQQTFKTQGYEAGKFVIQQLASYFPHLYVELQNHYIDHGDGYDDRAFCDVLFSTAQVLGLPVVVTQDSHYCHAEDKPIHETLKRLVSFSADADDAVFPGDSFHLAETSWIKSHFSDDVWGASETSFKSIVESHALAIKELDHYSYNIPKLVQDPQKDLEIHCLVGFNQKVKAPQSGGYMQRLNDELEVIRDTGMAGYLLLVKEVTDWCREQGVFTQARGSASGSIVCWLLGITQVDPLKYNLRFERFISRDRTKPPDIDLDVEDGRRDDLMEWLRSRFNICQIGTWAEFSIVVNKVDAEGVETQAHNEGRGSLLVAYLSRARKSGESLENIKTIHDLPPEDKTSLLTLSAMKPFKSCGTHAAGVVLTTSKEEFDRLVPTMLIPSSDTTVTQYEMDDIEKLGLVKLDVLGLRTLSLLRRTVELLGREVRDGLDFIPLSDARTFTTVRNGATDGIFQLEGWTARKGCREMQVRSLKDIIDIQALYRPAVMKSGGKDTYLRRKFGEEQVPERHDILTHNLKDTYGIPVFQEQVVGILRDIGFTPDDLTAFLKAIKASNSNIGDAGKVIAGYQERFGEIAGGLGFSLEDRVFTWSAFEGFAAYGFNRAHATTYGLTAYRMAWLKTHHPLEFATALLETSAGSPKEKDYLKAVREMGLKILRPDVNISSHTYTIDRARMAIRKGLVSIHGVGDKAAREIHNNSPYVSMDDLIKRCSSRAVTGGKNYYKDGTLNGTLAKLEEAGALSGIKND